MRGGGGVAVPEGVQEMTGCGLVDKVLIGQRLDSDLGGPFQPK